MILLSISLASCRDEAAPIRYVAPVHSSASVVLEPATLEIGEVATLEIAVVTPPNHRVAPFATPSEVDGLWILEAETLPIDRESNRWVHRTRVRLRPREVGQFRWPAGRVDIEVPDGDVQTLTIEPVSIAVVSVLPQFAGQLAPFGIEPLAVERVTSGRWVWAAGGALISLSCVGLIWLARRRSHGTDGAPPPIARSAAPWEPALSAIADSLERLDTDPLGACQRASIALRVYMSRRFGADATARTTEELEIATPPFAATSRWPGFVALLRRLDDLRFPAPDEGGIERARSVLRDSEAFVRNTIPNESTR